MRRAMRLVVIGSFAAALLVFGRAQGQHVDVQTKSTPVPVLDAIGLVDRSGPPRFKIGSYVKYEARGQSLAGISTHYDMTMTIGGEEIFWGEECFWLETVTVPKGKMSTSLATLVSYSMFDQGLPEAPVAYFQRKTVMEHDKDGKPVQSILKRATSNIITKDKDKLGFTHLIDTLGTETIKTPAGEFTCIKVREETGIGVSEEVGDSTKFTEHREVRTTYHTRQIPISGLARTDIEVTEHAKTWKVGQSQDVDKILMDRSTMRSDLVEFGEGREPELTPEAFRHPIKRSSTSASAKRR